MTRADRGPRAPQLRPDAPPDDVVLPEPGYAGERDPAVPPEASLPWLWFAVVGGLAAYMTHLVVVFWYLVVVCGPTAQVVSGIATAVAAAVAAAATWAGWRAWRALRRHEEEQRRRAEQERERREREQGRDVVREGPAPPPGRRRRMLAGLLLAARLPALLRAVAPAPVDDRPATSPAASWDPDPHARVRPLLAVAGTGLSALSLGILLLVGVSVVVVPTCA